MRTPTLLLAGVAGLGLVGVAVLAAEGALAAARTYLSPADAPPGSGEYGAGADLRLVVAGDSTAVGLGAGSNAATVGGRLAARLAVESGRRVLVSSVAVSGARSRDLPGQAAAALAARPDLVVVLVGANDATHGARRSGVRRDLGVAVRMLTDRRIPVVLATSPDLGAARNFAQPLRLVLAWQGRRVAAAEDAAVTEAGGVAVPLGRLTGPTFRADPSTLSRDEFHPSEHGYSVWADAIAPAVLQAVRRR
ncbi:MAG: hypothetical protein NVSMB13_17840 [Mycobacteriales bacterium]